jgi:hypothetical protein
VNDEDFNTQPHRRRRPASRRDRHRRFAGPGVLQLWSSDATTDTIDTIDEFIRTAFDEIRHRPGCAMRCGYGTLSPVPDRRPHANVDRRTRQDPHGPKSKA